MINHDWKLIFISYSFLEILEIKSRCIELLKTYRYGCRCVSSYLTSGETFCHNIDRDKASCQNGSANECWVYLIVWRLYRTAYTIITNRKQMVYIYNTPYYISCLFDKEIYILIFINYILILIIIFNFTTILHAFSKVELFSFCS